MQANLVFYAMPDADELYCRDNIFPYLGPALEKVLVGGGTFAIQCSWKQLPVLAEVLQKQSGISVEEHPHIIARDHKRCNIEPQLLPMVMGVKLDSSGALCQKVNAISGYIPGTMH
jgi:hypothetical protein